MLFVGLLEDYISDLDNALEAVVTFTFEYPFVVDDSEPGLGDYVVEINDEDDLKAWADRSFDVWEVR